MPASKAASLLLACSMNLARSAVRPFEMHLVTRATSAGAAARTRRRALRLAASTPVETQRMQAVAGPEAPCWRLGAGRRGQVGSRSSELLHQGTHCGPGGLSTCCRQSVVKKTADLQRGGREHPNKGGRSVESCVDRKRRRQGAPPRSRGGAKAERREKKTSCGQTDRQLLGEVKHGVQHTESCD